MQWGQKVAIKSHMGLFTTVVIPVTVLVWAHVHGFGFVDGEYRRGSRDVRVGLGQRPLAGGAVMVGLMVV
jgi:hypothetical protein